uniref:Potassium/proton antiporter CemA n=1 Tax=Schizomeris leibleinii TaxID=104533 RepID=F8SYB4_9CHLO|nr:chloroplast enveloppe membrane protein [Schizomeris leibleinii]AEH05354.1 chloroplast enveloppe membrane protein [Schizomeris leibleinii]
MTELEKIGLIPRSIVRMLDRFYYQLYLGTAEPLVKQFRFSKYLLLTSVKSLFVVLFIPFFINVFTKIYVFRPLVEYFWDTKQTEIFLNYELQEKAFSEIKNFEEKIYFEYLIKTENQRNYNWNVESPIGRFTGSDLSSVRKNQAFSYSTKNAQPVNVNIVTPLNYSVENESSLKFVTNPLVLEQFGSHLPYYLDDVDSKNWRKSEKNPSVLFINDQEGIHMEKPLNSTYDLQEEIKVENLFWGKTSNLQDSKLPLEKPNSSFSSEKVSNQNKAFYISLEKPFVIEKSQQAQNIFRQKTRELAEHYNKESIEAITNLFADFMGLIILIYLLINMKMSLMNTTAFLSESFFSLKDSKKAFLMLLFTDLLVGFHSPRGWEVIFHFLFEHFGLPENHNIIFLLVGTFPVLLDALFKYWIFRHLNRHSPATVATFQAMVE